MLFNRPFTYKTLDHLSVEHVANCKDLFSRYFDAKKGKFEKSSVTADGAVLPRSFVALVLDPIFKVMKRWVLFCINRILSETP